MSDSFSKAKVLGRFISTKQRYTSAGFNLAYFQANNRILNSRDRMIAGVGTDTLSTDTEPNRRLKRTIELLKYSAGKGLVCRVTCLIFSDSSFTMEYLSLLRILKNRITASATEIFARKTGAVANKVVKEYLILNPAKNDLQEVRFLMGEGAGANRNEGYYMTEFATAHKKSGLWEIEFP